jgi:excisionase family DNA binding protein
MQRSDQVGLVNNLMSPRQAAKVVGVSESSLKRWCDQGLIPVVRTVGGHRKLPIGNVIKFVEERDRPKVLELDPRLRAALPMTRHETGLEKNGEHLAEALLQGDESLARQIVFNFYLAKDSISAICDEVLWKAFREIVSRCEAQTAEVYQERRSREIVQRILFEMRRTQAEPDLLLPACGGAFEGDGHPLPTMMVELVLRDAGWNATSLGSSIPPQSMAKAIDQLKPKLFWVFASHISDVNQFVLDFKSVWKVAKANGTALVIGGRAFKHELRERLTYCCHCDTMQQLEAFAKTVHPAGMTKPA